MEEPGRSGVQYHEVVTVDDETYKIHMLDPNKGVEMGMELMQIIGEPIAAMTAASDEKGATQAAQAAVKALLQNLKPKEVSVLFQKLCSTVEYNKAFLTGGAYSVHFQAKLGHLTRVVSKVIEVQFSDFFGAIVGVVGDLIAKVGQ